VWTAYRFPGGAVRKFDELISFPPYVAALRYPGSAQDDRNFLQTDRRTRQGDRPDADGDYKVTSYATTVGRVKGAQGIGGVRAALLQLFDGFTLHRASSKAAPPRVHTDLAWLGNSYEYVIDPHVRPQVVEGYTE
jgi:hypothetical protein